MTVRGWGRALRAGVFAAVCVLLAALGHVIMSGTPVPWWAMAAGAAGTGTAGWLLAGRERGRTLIVTVVTAAQVVLHETFSLAQALTTAATPGPDAAARAAGPVDMSGMDMGSAHMGSAHMGSAHMDSAHMGFAHMGSLYMDLMDMGSMAHAMTGVQHVHGMAGMAGMGGSVSYGMFAAHLLAAVLCGLWLAYGERAFFGVLRAAATRLVAPLRMLLAGPAPLPRPLAGRRRATDVPTPARLLLCCSLTSRAPPTGAAVA
ncbi:hypothetical protein [Streptomyces humi]|uniref:hypothetical protein n=1 Tax=Streptomyces humi TaxID=1428620 RepID=UPI0006286D57|nr:hypothetical protein [Streptomyces humi]